MSFWAAALTWRPAVRPRPRGHVKKISRYRAAGKASPGIGGPYPALRLFRDATYASLKDKLPPDVWDYPTEGKKEWR